MEKLRMLWNGKSNGFLNEMNFSVRAWPEIQQMIEYELSYTSTKVPILQRNIGRMTCYKAALFTHAEL